MKTARFSDAQGFCRRVFRGEFTRDNLKLGSQAFKLFERQRVA